MYLYKTCYKCKINKRLTEFEYYYFKKKYHSNCKCCEALEKKL